MGHGKTMRKRRIQPISRKCLLAACRSSWPGVRFAHGLLQRPLHTAALVAEDTKRRGCMSGAYQNISAPGAENFKWACHQLNIIENGGAV